MLVLRPCWRAQIPETRLFRILAISLRKPTINKFLLHPVGSAGDVFPFIGLGLALKSRGHDVTILTSGYFQETVERAGLEFVDTLPKDDFLQLANNPRLWHPVWGAGTILRSMTRPLLRQCYDEIEARYEPGKTVLLTPCIGFAAKLAHESLGIPLITVALQPALLWSRHNGPVLDGVAQWGPHWLKRLLYLTAERLLMDPYIMPALNGLRAELGLKKIAGITRWWLSNQCILGLFPEWFAPRQPDWPDTVSLTEFPLWNENANESLPEDVAKFLDEGDPPIVFTPGSANMYGDSFFATAVEACQTLGRRGMLFSKFDEQIPDSLPQGIQHFKYAPFSQLLPGCAAICHHGGIGTSANALASGIPQLIMPYTYDQPDNATRLSRLGVGDFLKKRKFKPIALAEKLSKLLEDKAVANSCRELAEKINAANPFADACRVAEQRLEKIFVSRDALAAGRFSFLANWLPPRAAQL